SDVIVPQVYQGGLSLPDRDYYLNTDPRSKMIRDEFVKHISKLFVLYGLDETASENYAATVMRIETALAGASMSREDQRNPYKTYHKVTIPEINAMTPDLKWDEMMNSLNVKGHYDYLVLGQPDFLKELQHQLKATSLSDWKIYLKWNLLNMSANVLSNDFV